MSEIEKRIRAQATETFKKNNPQMFAVTPAECYWSNEERVALENSVKTDPSAIVRLSVSLSHDEFKLNKTERAYYQVLKECGRFAWLGVQPITLKLGDDCRYTPDFLALTNEGKLQAYEVKGFMRDDALVKLKVASRMYRFIQFFVVKKLKGQWDLKGVRP